MSGFAAGLRTAAVRLVAAPGAVFLAVLTAGLATSATARHSGLFVANARNRTQPRVVLACPRSRTVNAERASDSSATNPSCRRSASASAALPAADKPRAMDTASDSSHAEKHADTKAGGASASIPLPDFNAPELSRFTSPL
jgi:hypothetical protein